MQIETPLYDDAAATPPLLPLTTLLMLYFIEILLCICFLLNFYIFTQVEILPLM